MENHSKDISWLDKIIKRFKDLGVFVPPIQKRIYEAIGREFAAGRTIVDVGCSTGADSNVLSVQARHVWGIDVNKEAVSFAIQAFSRPNLSFDEYDLENPPTREVSKFDLVVCIEVIEHLADLEVGINNLKRFFGKDSIGFISVPNINNEEIKIRDAANPLHLHHWTAGEFYELMIKHFASVTLYSAEKLDTWSQEETVDGNTTDKLLVAKVEIPK